MEPHLEKHVNICSFFPGGKVDWKELKTLRGIKKVKTTRMHSKEWIM